MNSSKSDGKSIFMFILGYIIIISSHGQKKTEHLSMINYFWIYVNITLVLIA